MNRESITRSPAFSGQTGIDGNPLPATYGIMSDVFVNMNWVCRVLERQDELQGAKYLINFLGQETSAAKFPGGVEAYKKTVGFIPFLKVFISKSFDGLVFQTAVHRKTFDQNLCPVIT